MKVRAACVLAAVSMVICTNGMAQKNKFNLIVHVESSDYSVSCNRDYTCYGLQKLNVTIDDSGYILASEDAAVVTGVGQLAYVLRNGYYHARIVKEDAKDPAEYHRVIELQLANGVTRRYTVIGERGSELVGFPR